MTTITGPREPRNYTITQGDPLTRRETQVMELLVRGATNREIASSLVCAVKTVENHVSNIMVKAGLGRRVLLALWWSKQ